VASPRRALRLYITLFRAADALSNAVMPRLAAAGLTWSQWGALEALYHLGPMRQRRLAEKILRGAANMTVVLDNLEEAGLVRRAADATDRRARMVALTARGSALVRKLFPLHAADIAQAMAALSAADQDVAASLLRRLGMAAGPGRG
jgi:MarR family transcriptional regulator, 2-MHQ and catechol-resistance regulon repressor